MYDQTPTELLKNIQSAFEQLIASQNINTVQNCNLVAFIDGNLMILEEILNQTKDITEEKE